MKKSEGSAPVGWNIHLCRIVISNLLFFCIKTNTLCNHRIATTAPYMVRHLEPECTTINTSEWGTYDCQDFIKFPIFHPNYIIQPSLQEKAHNCKCLKWSTVKTTVFINMCVSIHITNSETVSTIQEKHFQID